MAFAASIEDAHRRQSGYCWAPSPTWRMGHSGRGHIAAEVPDEEMSDYGNRPGANRLHPRDRLQQARNKR